MNLSQHPSSSPWRASHGAAEHVTVPQVSVIPPYQGPGASSIPSFGGAPKRRIRTGLTGSLVGSLVLYLLGFSALFFGGSYLISPAPSVEIQSVGVGIAPGGERGLALVPYSRSGAKGMFDLMFQPMFQQRLAAVDLESGERVWDVKLTDDLVWDAGVLGAGKSYAYLTSSDGLIVVKLSDGSIVARGDGIDGLGAEYVAAYPAYGFDTERQLVIAMAADGGIRSIPLDSLTASPADAATNERWAGRLSDKPFAPSPSTATASEARLDANARIVVQPAAAGALAGTLVRIDAGGNATPIGGTVLYNAKIVIDLTVLPDEDAPAAAVIAPSSLDEQIQNILDTAAASGLDQDAIDTLIQDATRTAAGLDHFNATTADGTPAAAGSASGYVLVQHAENQNDDELLLSAISLDTGKIIASTPMGSDLERSLTAPSGVTAVVVTPTGDNWPRDLAIVGADGKITRVRIGATNFFGLPA